MRPVLHPFELPATGPPSAFALKEPSSSLAHGLGGTVPGQTVEPARFVPAQEFDLRVERHMAGGKQELTSLEKAAQKSQPPRFQWIPGSWSLQDLGLHYFLLILPPTPIIFF